MDVEPEQSSQKKKNAGTKHLKECSLPLAVKEMQFKATSRFHLCSIKTAKINKTSHYKCWRRCREKGTLIHC